MKKILLLILFPYLIFSQNINEIFSNKGEIYFAFKCKNQNLLNSISKIISLDHNTTNQLAYAYANKKEFKEFLKFGINYKIIEKKPVIFSGSTKSNWNYYPTYQEYVDIMQTFSDSFPTICKTHSLTTLNSGREILIVQISNNVGQKENEPSFLYTSSMHGDELAGYVLCLRLIDYILKGYGTDPRLTNLVNEIDIWINPLANPDGTYAGGNQDISMATRYNANWIDLNRNYPDPQDGPHPDGNSYQAETNCFLNLADSIKFNLSANIHGGVEVCNYPWDTWSNLTADDNWWQYVSNEYANLCQTNGNNGYFDDLNNGITNGYDWYEVNGGRQDYMNYFKHCREITLELSNDKIPHPNELSNLWDANYLSLLNYMEQSLFGLRGIVTDSITGNPLKAKVEIIGHDIDSSHVYSNLPIGNYHRYLIQGNYDVTFKKNGYYPKTINTTIINNNISTKNIQLVPIDISTNSEIKNQPHRQANQLIDLLGRKNNAKKNSIQIITNNQRIIKKQNILE